MGSPGGYWTGESLGCATSSITKATLYVVNEEAQ